MFLLLVLIFLYIFFFCCERKKLKIWEILDCNKKIFMLLIDKEYLGSIKYLFYDKDLLVILIFRE